MTRSTKRSHGVHFTYWLSLPPEIRLSPLKIIHFLFDFGMRQHIYAWICLRMFSAAERRDGKIFIVILLSGFMRDKDVRSQAMWCDHNNSLNTRLNFHLKCEYHVFESSKKILNLYVKCQKYFSVDKTERAILLFYDLSYPFSSLRWPGISIVPFYGPNNIAVY